MAVFTVGELLDIAVGIERNGVTYYESLTQLTPDTELKSIYSGLASMERHHIDVFQNLRAGLSGGGAIVPPESEEEYATYLKALVDSSVFTSDQVAREMAQKASGPAEALQLALGAEKDSILFYTEMRELVSQRERDAVDKIVREERKHVRELSQLKQRYA
ncbi:ferritin family protein [Chloroflexota bacterium]